MDTVLFSIGDIIRDKQQNTRYRIIAIVENYATLCEMDTTKFLLSQIENETLIRLLSSDEIEKCAEDNIVFDIDRLSPTMKERYETKVRIMNEVVAVSAPAYISLAGKTPKPEIKEIMNKYNVAKNSFWRMCTSYFQSGMKNYSLIDSRALGTNKGKTYQYTSKPGKKSEYIESTGVVLTDEIIGYFEEALNDYKSGRQKTIRSSFDYMNLRHFTRTELVNGVASVVLLPVSERPTLGQLYYYIEKHLTQQEKDLIKTSVAEQRNNKRLIISDSLDGVCGPGDMVEIDACEADVSLVSTFDSNQTIGRPVVYFMIDVYTRVILAVSVAFDNNSVLGVTNLFLNLADDKREYCSRFGMGFDTPAMWPSNIIPRRLRVDRGSEFKSKEFDRICNELGIEKQIVSGASGSLKGIVEQSFHQMHSRQNVHLENYGLIEKRYDSAHHKEATLNIEQYTKMVINFVLMHNQQYDENYHLTREMIEQKVKPIPAELWAYGIKKCSQPRPIPVKEQYLYNLMTPVKAKLSRRGICYKDLWYYPDDDPKISRDMFNAGTKKIPYEVRMDMRSVGAIYYLRDGKLIKAPLNDRITGNADYANLTMKEYEDYRMARKQMDAQGRVHNEELSSFNYAVNEHLVSEVKKESFSNSKNMRPARELEKQAVSVNGKIETRLDDSKHVEEPKTITTNKTQKPEATTDKRKTTTTYSSWDEALDDFED